MESTTSHVQTRSSQKLYVKQDAALKFICNILESNGVPSENASIIAKALVLADLRGVDTHGINRIPSYVKRIRQGVLDPKASPELKQVTPVVAQVDGRNSFGFLGAHVSPSPCASLQGSLHSSTAFP